MGFFIKPPSAIVCILGLFQGEVVIYYLIMYKAYLKKFAIFMSMLNGLFYSKPQT